MAEEKDISYRLIYSYPEMVEDLLRQFIAEDWIDQLNFATLEKVSERDIDQRLLRREKDLLWRVHWNGQDARAGEWLYIFIHLEFQSRPDRFMALREVTYKALLYEDLVRRNQFTRSGRLPPVLAIALYNGKRPWNEPTSLEALVEPLPGRSAAESILSYKLIDERRYDPKLLAELQSPTAMLFQLEQVEDVSTLAEAIQQVAAKLRTAEKGRLLDPFNAWVQAILLPRMSEKLAVGFRKNKSLKETSTMLAQTVTKWTEDWKNEGIKKGRKDMLEKQLQARFGRLSKDMLQRLDDASSAQLDDWSIRLLNAATVQDVFAD